MSDCLCLKINQNKYYIIKRQLVVQQVVSLDVVVSQELEYYQVYAKGSIEITNLQNYFYIGLRFFNAGMLPEAYLLSWALFKFRFEIRKESTLINF